MQVLGDDDVHEMADIFRETSDCFQLEFHRAVFKTYFACYTLLTHPATDTTKGSNIVSLRRSALTAWTMLLPLVEHNAAVDCTNGTYAITRVRLCIKFWSLVLKLYIADETSDTSQSEKRSIGVIHATNMLFAKIFWTFLKLIDLTSAV